MSFFSRFFGKREPDDRRGDEPVANPDCTNPLSLQVLLASGRQLNAGAVTATLRAYHPSMAQAQAEIEPELSQQGQILGLAGWGRHVVKLVGFDRPMPGEAVEACVAPAHYGPDLKAQARAHGSHVLLYYAGHDPSPLEQYVALAAVSGALSEFGALVVLNESARTSFPAAALSSRGLRGDTLELLRTLPLPALFCGFVKYEVEGIPGIWMRTYGAHLLGLPDLATHAAGHHQGERFFNLFDSILRYMQNSGAQLAAGHTAQAGPDTYLRFRAPAAEEYFLESDGTLLVAELVRADQVNR